MPGDSKNPPRPRLSEPVLRKLDGGLRQLLGMSEEELTERVEIERARSAKRRVSPTDLLPPTASSEERKAAEILEPHVTARPIPHPVFGAVKIDPAHLKPARVRAIVQFSGNRDDLTALGLEVHSQAQDT